VGHDTAPGHAEPLMMCRPPAARRDTGLSVLRLMFAAAAAATVVLAAAVPALTARAGHFTDSTVPVWSEPVDGWSCHLLGHCQDPAVRPPGSRPGQVLRDAGGRAVVVECALGNFYKLDQPLSGWVPAPSVATTADPLGCYAGEF